LNDRLLSSFFACVVAFGVALPLGACGPSDPTQTLAFTLSNDAKNLTAIEFVASHAEGNFAGTDGACIQGSGFPVDTTTVTVEISTTLDTTTTSSSSSTLDNLATGPAPASANEAAVSGDVSAEANSFEAVVTESGALRVRIVEDDGIRPGTVLAYCRFHGDPAKDLLIVRTTSCERLSGDDCVPSTDAEITIITTTTTTTTTTSTTSSTTTTTTTTTVTLIP
jgi:hypothetical protein